MPSLTTKAKALLRVLAGGLGILLFGYLVHRAGLAKLAASIATLGWGLAFVLLWGCVAHIAKAWAWRLTLLEEKRHVSFARLLGLRLGSEALGQLGSIGQLFGEGMRVSLLGPKMSLCTGIASVTIDRVFFVLSAATVTVIGLLAVLMILPLGHTLAVYACVTAVILLGVISLSAIAIRRRWPVLSVVANALSQIPYCRRWIEREWALIHSVEETLLNFYHRTPKAFWASLGLNLVCHAAAVFEVFLILWLMGAKLGLFGALAVEALTKLVNIAGTFNPGNLGTYEGGNMLIGKLFGLTAGAGLTLACVRRLRALFWAAVGGLGLVILTKRPKHNGRIARDEDGMRNPQASIRPKVTESTKGSRRPSHAAVVLAHNLGAMGRTSPVPQIGAVPILLRAILGAEKAGAARIFVVLDRLKNSQMQRELLRTGRLPGQVTWRWVRPGEQPLPLLLGRIALEVEGHLVLIAGDRVYHPSLHNRAAEWGGDGDALTFTTGFEVVGMCSLSREAAISLTNDCPLVADSTDDFVSWLTMTHSVKNELVAEEKWQLVQSELQRMMAERKLDSWLVKPTDGIFARANRRISIPISRRIILFPITPNMVSLFTLGVSFAGGVFLALGGYWNMLAGALLSWFSSVLDGCDGEVARLKLQESSFGCWLETICDNLYYLFTFGGLALGLARTTGNQNYLVWGAFLLLGAIASFLMTGIQRHQLAGGRPEQYLREWHRKADKRSSSPLLYLGRHTEFIIRRCFLPYLIIVFALFGVMNWLLVGATIGANVVWMIALYSYLSFNSDRRTSVPRPAI